VTPPADTSVRSSYYFAAAALLVAAVALALAIVSAVRAGSEGGDDAAAGGMDMAAMEHGAAVPSDGVANATARRGGQPLTHTSDGDTWVFDLTAKPIKWEILPGVRVTGWTYNGTVPGPEIRVPYGQKVRVVVENELPEPTTVHWHGIAVPNAMDGVPDVTQEPIAAGATFTYEFRAVPTADGSQGGTFVYHSHFDEDRQVSVGLAAPFVIEPRVRAPVDVERTLMLAEWSLNAQSGQTRPAMPMDGMFPNFFTINGKAFPATETISVRRGQRVLLRVIGSGQFNHPMHLHGMSFRIVAKDGTPLPDPVEADVVDVAPGERYDLLFTADAPGKWIFHCHIGHHMTNNGTGPGGLINIVEVT
jgi:manganese oxidase